MSVIYCDRLGQQRTLRRSGSWWVVVDPRNSEVLSGGFKSQRAACAELKLQESTATPTRKNPT